MTDSKTLIERLREKAETIPAEERDAEIIDRKWGSDD